MTPLLLIALPFMSSVAIMFFGTRMGRLGLSVVGIGGIALSAVGALSLLSGAHSDLNVSQKLFTWIPGILTFQPVEFSVHLDTLSLTMAVVVSFVSSLIALYSWEYMGTEEGLPRFFATVNLFVAFMLLLVLADNLLLLFMGWEGVGLCSYILIGFYFREPNAEKAAMKAFITTRIGDVFLLFGIILCYLLFGTLTISNVIEQANNLYHHGSLIITIIALCFLGGAVGKSAQLPLQTWLADAMWGPTPVSALIHAATMVTAGVYLIARLSGLFMLSPVAQSVVLIVGAATLLFAGIIASVQTDMKKVLAYSTMSQLGYMFLALGAGAYQAAIFHLVTHAFFKALLFLSAGVIGHSLHTYDLRKMGGLKKSNPLLFWLFLIGSLNLMGLPFITAGFFSKEWIMSQVGPLSWAWSAGIIGALLTGFYTSRMIILAFYGQNKITSKDHMGWMMSLPSVVLAFFSLIIGWLETPHSIGNMHFMASWLSPLPSLNGEGEESLLLLFFPTIMAALGAGLAIAIYGIKRSAIRDHALSRFVRNGGGFEELYNFLLIKPYLWLSKVVQNDIFSASEKIIIALMNAVFSFIRLLHSGKLASYISFIVVAALVMAGTMVVL